MARSVTCGKDVLHIGRHGGAFQFHSTSTVPGTGGVSMTERDPVPRLRILEGKQTVWKTANEEGTQEGCCVSFWKLL